MPNYGETIRYEDGVIDLGAVSDDYLAYLHDEFTAYLKHPYGIAYERECDEEALDSIEWEIAYRLKHGEVIPEDLDGSWRCALPGCYCDKE